ncbi:MAG TPA: PilX N-terminal domain-containing pilus assembly protein, partial [Burkholderiaceae bacterium]|nr:PilX N-terminal domain-containing pilus assembly protein [Burkholderiaceae bacterium]
MKTTRPVQGASSLAIIMVWLVAASLVVLYANRALIFEQRASANQARSAQAFEAAEAGIEWALAVLSHPGPVDSQCQPTDAAGARTLRERLLQVDGATGRV